MHFETNLAVTSSYISKEWHRQMHFYFRGTKTIRIKIKLVFLNPQTICILIMKLSGTNVLILGLFPPGRKFDRPKHLICTSTVCFRVFMVETMGFRDNRHQWTINMVRLYYLYLLRRQFIWQSSLAYNRGLLMSV